MSYMSYVESEECRRQGIRSETGLPSYRYCLRQTKFVDWLRYGSATPVKEELFESSSSALCAVVDQDQATRRDGEGGRQEGTKKVSSYSEVVKHVNNIIRGRG